MSWEVVRRSTVCLYMNQCYGNSANRPLTKYTGPVTSSSANVFDDFDDEHGHSLIGSLHLDADDEPVRRGASRANSVRFATNDVSAIHGADWSGSRSSGEFGLGRPSSGLGGHPIERSSSHKSDGRHSSAGHSVHSGRTSSLGLDTNFQIGGLGDDQSPHEMPEPPPGLFILGSVPSIIRCWLDETFQTRNLLYAAVCTGSQNSTIEHGLVKEMGMTGAIHKNSGGASFIRLPVYLPEAIVSHPATRASSPSHHLPSFTATFEVVHFNKLSTDRRKAIRVFVGSDTLRAHSADVLFSRNALSLYGDDRNKLMVPFVRPEDEMTFKNLRTINTADRIELKATALPFKPSEVTVAADIDSPDTKTISLPSIAAESASNSVKALSPAIMAQKLVSETKPEPEPAAQDASSSAADESDANTTITPQTPQTEEPSNVMDTEQRDLPRVWGSWRTNGASGADDSTFKDTNAYTRKPSTSGLRSMKVLKPSKAPLGRTISSAARTGPSYERPVTRVGAEPRRKSQGGLDSSAGRLNSLDAASSFGLGEKSLDRGLRSTDRPFDKASSLAGRWDTRKSANEEKSEKSNRPVLVPMLSKSTNPVGGASAFVWTK